MTTRSQDISQEIKTAAAEITSPQLSFAFGAKAEEGYEASAQEAGKPAIGEMFNLAGGQQNQNEQLLAMASGSVDGLQARGSALSKHHKDTAERERRQKGKTGDAVLFALLDQIDANLAQIEMHREQIEILKEEQEALESHIEKLRNGEDIELNEDGSLKDEVAERAIKKYEEQEGETIDRKDLGQVQKVLTKNLEEQRTHQRSIEHIEKENEEIIQSTTEFKNATKDELAQKVKEHSTNEFGQRKLEAVTAGLDDEKQAEIAKEREFDGVTEQKVLDASFDSAKGDFFVGNALGSGNPFVSGAVSSEFEKMAIADNAEQKPSDDLNVDHQIQEKFDLGKIV